MFQVLYGISWALWCALLDYLLYFLLDFIYARRRTQNRSNAEQNAVWRLLCILLLILSIPIYWLHHTPVILWLMTILTLLFSYRQYIMVHFNANRVLSFILTAIGSALNTIINSLIYLYRSFTDDEITVQSRPNPQQWNRVPLLGQNGPSASWRHNLTRDPLHSDTTSGYGSPFWRDQSSLRSSPRTGFATSTPVDHFEGQTKRRMILKSE